MRRRSSTRYDILRLLQTLIGGGGGGGWGGEVCERGGRLRPQLRLGAAAPRPLSAAAARVRRARSTP